MKNYIAAAIILGCIVLFPENLSSDVFSIKLNLGMSSGGRVDDKWTNTTDYFLQGNEREVDHFFTIHKSLELVFPLYQNFSLSFGVGHFSKTLSGSTGIFSFPDSSDLSGDFYANPAIHFQSIPVLVTAQWGYTVWPEAKVYVLGGVGRYFSKLNIYDHNIIYDLQDPAQALNYFPLNYNGRASSMGYHGGAGFEIHGGNNFYLFVESLYRSVKLKKIESLFIIDERSDAFNPVQEQLGENVAQSTFIHYINWGGENVWGDIIYSINNILLSELIFRAGIRIGF